MKWLQLSCGCNEDQTKMFNAKCSKAFLILVACSVNMCFLSTGISYGWSSPILPKLTNTTDDPSSSANVNPLPSTISSEEESWIGSLLLLGAAMGTVTGGLVAEKFGRKYALILCSVFFIVSFGLGIVANEIYQFYILRLFGGVGIGITFCVLTIYIAEIAENSVRGSLCALMYFFMNVGGLISYSASPYMTVSMFSVLCVIFPIVTLIAMVFYVPESPHFLVSNDKLKEAELALKKLRNKADVQNELDEIKAFVEESKTTKGSLIDVLKSKGLLKAFFLVLGLMTYQQTCGINVVLFYTQSIFRAAGASDLSPTVSAIIVAASQTLSSSIAPNIVDRLGRRILLLISGGGLCVSHVLMGTYFYMQYQSMDISNLSWMPLTGMILIIVFMCLGYGPLPWTVLSEVFPSNLKTSAAVFNSLYGAVVGFIVARFFNDLVLELGLHWVFWIFAIICLSSVVFVLLLLPETKGKSLQEIQDILNGKQQNL